MADLLTRTYQILHDETGEDEDRLAGSAVYAASVEGALLEYSRLRPRLLRQQVTLVAGYDQPYPSAWDAGLSTLVSVEFPPGYQKPRLITHSGLSTGPNGWRMLNRTHTPGETAILTYTAPWTQQTLPESLTDGVAHLAASLVAQAVAAEFGRSDKPAVPVDSVNYRDKADVWRALARDLRQRGLLMLGIGVDANGNTVNNPASRDAVWGWPSW